MRASRTGTAFTRHQVLAMHGRLIGFYLEVRRCAGGDDPGAVILAVEGGVVRAARRGEPPI
jgi:hypothetical protein